MGQALLSLSTLLFAITFFFFGMDIMLATRVLFISSAISAVVMALSYKRIKGMEWAAIGATLFLSGLAIFFNEEGFVLWRPSIINSVVGGGLILLYFMKKAPFEYLFGRTLELELPEEEWLKINIIWGIFLFICALINAVVVLMVTGLDLPMKVWVTTKVIVMPIITLIFTAMLLFHLSRKGKQYLAMKENRE